MYQIVLCSELKTFFTLLSGFISLTKPYPLSGSVGPKATSTISGAAKKQSLLLAGILTSVGGAGFLGAFFFLVEFLVWASAKPIAKTIIIKNDNTDFLIAIKYLFVQIDKKNINKI